MAEFSEKNLEQGNEGTNFIFPQESSETKKAISDAENKINTSVKIFANALDTISPWLTNELLNIFDINKKNPAFKWLSESDLWLQSLWLLYERNVDKIPDKLENILNKMLELLTQYKSVRQKSKTLEEMLRACASINGISDQDKLPDLWINHSTFQQTNFKNRWRDNI